MAIRRSDTRRRRVGVLSDENSVPVVASDAPKAKPKSSKTKKKESAQEVSEYSVSARRRHLAKTTDLIPKRAWAVALVAATLIVLVGVVNVLFHYASDMVPVLGERALSVFSLTGQGSLAQWCSTILLIFAGLASIQVYALRRHRSNDYVGTYALWLWVAVGLLLASLWVSVGLHELAINACNHVTGSEVTLGGWFLISVKLLLLIATAVRLMVEVRQSRMAIFGVGLTAAIFLMASLIDLPWLRESVGESRELAFGNLLLVGNTILFSTVVVYARFVYLRAQGISSAQAVTARAQAKTQAKADKQQAKADKLAAKEQAKADRLAEIEQAKADKIAAREQAIADKEQAKADKLATIEQAKADKLAAKEQAKADKEQAKADKARAAQESKTKKQQDKVQQSKSTKKSKRNVESELAETETETIEPTRKMNQPPLSFKMQTQKSKSNKKRRSEADSELMEEEAFGDEIPQGGKLSKRQLKKLRKQQKQQRRAA